MNFYKSKEYWYNFVVVAVLPALKEYVQKTENKLDDSIYEAVVRLADALLGPKEIDASVDAE